MHGFFGVCNFNVRHNDCIASKFTRLLNADLFSVPDLSDLGSSLTTSGINSRIEFSREAVEMSLQEFAEMFATKAKVVDHQGQSKKSSVTSNNTGIGKIISTGVRNTANSIEGCFVSKTTWNSEQVSGLEIVSSNDFNFSYLSFIQVCCFIDRQKILGGKTRF